jgi:ribonuclease HI
MTDDVRSLHVYTDACVRGALYHDARTERAQRRRVGPAAAGCIGWVSLETAPALEADVCLEGHLGPNRAEYHAVTLGLSNALVYVTTTDATVTDVIVYSDNEIVVSTLTLRKEAKALLPYRQQVRELQGWLERDGVEVHYEWVPRNDPRHKRAHQLADRARNSLGRQDRQHPSEAP